MIDFQWELKQVVSGIRKGLLEKQVTFFLRPHDAIWGDNSTDFTQLADEIMALLPDKQMQRQFLSVCLGSCLLNPTRAQKAVPAWIHGKMPVADLLGIDVTLDEVLSWRWDRVGFPVLDEYEHGKNDTIYYALVAKTTSEANPLYPTWAADVMNADALDAVTIAAELAEKAHPGRRFFFWPFINPRKPTHDRSLGLPVYLSFLSLAKDKRIPMFIATGEVDRQGRLHPVHGVSHKWDKTFDKEYKLFIYPVDESRLEQRRECRPVVVNSLEQAEQEWGISSPKSNLKFLKELLSPIAYQDDLKRQSTNFIGREWLTEKIDIWLNDPNGSRAFMLVGPPGIGKTAFSAWLCSNRTNVAAWHFCCHYSEERKNSSNMVRSLAYQLASNFPRYAEQLYRNLQLENAIQTAVDEYALIDELLIKPLHELITQGCQPDKTLVIIIDALDEAATGNSNPIARLVSRKMDELPSWIRLVVTSRNVGEISAAKYGPEPCMLEAMGSQNLADIANFLEEMFSSLSADALKAVVLKSEGIFLYAVQLAREIQSGVIQENLITSLPIGLNDFYRGQFERLFSSNLQQYKSEIRPLLCLVSASYEPLPLGLIKSILGIKNRMELSDRLDVLSSLFPYTGIRDNDTISPCHRSINEWISDWDKAGIFFIDVEYGHQLFADYGLAELKKAIDVLPEYLLIWLPSHLIASGRVTESIEILKDFSFMMMRTKQGLLESMLEYYQTSHNKELSAEKAFFQENAHILRRGNDTWPAFKILLQLAIEHADDSPLTEGAEKFLADGKCDWNWLRKTTRSASTMKKQIKSILSLSEISNEVLSDIRATLISNSAITAMLNNDSALLYINKKLFVWDCTGNLIKSENIDNFIISSCKYACLVDDTVKIYDFDNKEIVKLKTGYNIIKDIISLSDNKYAYIEGNNICILDLDDISIIKLNTESELHTNIVRLSNGYYISWACNNFTSTIWSSEGKELNESILSVWSSDGKIINKIKHINVNNDFRYVQKLAVIELSDRRLLTYCENSFRIWDESFRLIKHVNFCAGYDVSFRELPDKSIISTSSFGIILWYYSGDFKCLISCKEDLNPKAQIPANTYDLSLYTDQWDEEPYKSPFNEIDATVILSNISEIDNALVYDDDVPIVDRMILNNGSTMTMLCGDEKAYLLQLWNESGSLVANYYMDENENTLDADNCFIISEFLSNDYAPEYFIHNKKIYKVSKTNDILEILVPTYKQKEKWLDNWFSSDDEIVISPNRYHYNYKAYFYKRIVNMDYDEITGCCDDDEYIQDKDDLIYTKHDRTEDRFNLQYLDSSNKYIYSGNNIYIIAFKKIYVINILSMTMQSLSINEQISSKTEMYDLHENIILYTCYNGTVELASINKNDQSIKVPDSSKVYSHISKFCNDKFLLCCNNTIDILDSNLNVLNTLIYFDANIVWANAISDTLILSWSNDNKLITFDSSIYTNHIGVEQQWEYEEAYSLNDGSVLIYKKQDDEFKLYDKSNNYITKLSKKNVYNLNKNSSRPVKVTEFVFWSDKDNLLYIYKRDKLVFYSYVEYKFTELANIHVIYIDKNVHCVFAANEECLSSDILDNIRTNIISKYSENKRITLANSIIKSNMSHVCHVDGIQWHSYYNIVSSCFKPNGECMIHLSNGDICNLMLLSGADKLDHCNHMPSQNNIEISIDQLRIDIGKCVNYSFREMVKPVSCGRGNVWVPYGVFRRSVS